MKCKRCGNDTTLNGICLDQLCGSDSQDWAFTRLKVNLDIAILGLEKIAAFSEGPVIIARQTLAEIRGSNPEGIEGDDR